MLKKKKLQTSTVMLQSYNPIHRSSLLLQLCQTLFAFAGS